jgi:type II secretory pathway pseudopilin PulG
VIELLVVLVVVGVAAAFVAAPLRGDRGVGAERREQAERADLEAAKEAKYHEIRDAELDYRTGKLSEQDWRALDSALRAEAIGLLRRLDELS